MIIRKPFDKDCRELMDEESFPRVTGIPYDEAFSLTGAYGVKPFHDLRKKDMHKYYPSPQLLVTELLFCIETELRFYNNSIHAELIIAPGYGERIMISKIENAIRLGFDFIDCEAARGMHSDGRTPYLGYKLWHRYGFRMDKLSQINFEKFISDRKLEKKIKEDENFENLLEFTSYSDEYKLLWDKEGESWGGVFDLKEGSPSRETFANYKASSL
ncbi:hypothetical protein [Ferruginibacter sp. HRS2-29]|uniref:hypothetical protein n=1 Tax=Ferruginibacter sp. HRS2-29 TaxID=2487334 RepID=UPI0020CCD9A7|nr:hypothetical protein [Ferruginibacter sp. HRS2-29]MCP9749992.1 hypothetical protein [Ferruginibacter sp. HRS2-29]